MPQVEGLRGIAILFVVLTHLDKTMFLGGFLGVDVFFVISGFVITESCFRRRQMILESKESGLSFWLDFYRRRAIRIIPVLLIYTLVTVMVFVPLTPEPRTLIGSARSALVGLSNLTFFRASTDYFGADVQNNPFLQTWSLGIEEQFYFFFPLLLMAGGFFVSSLSIMSVRKRLVSLGGFTICASLLSAILVSRSDPSAAFFLPQFRAWELAAGLLCSLTAGISAQKKGLWMSKMASNASLLGILFGLYFFSPDFFAGRVIVVALTSVVIYASKSVSIGRISDVVLESKVLCFLGRISYSLYLWHWGVLVISRLTIGIHWWSVPFQLLFIYFAARVSYAVVEVPLRSINSPRRVLQLSLTAVATSSAIGLLLIKPLFGNLYLGGNKKVRQEYPELPDGRRLRKTVCFEAEPNQIDEVIDRCLLYPRSKKGLIWLIGDSHAEALLPAAAVAAADNEMGLFAYASGITVFPSLPLYRAGEKAFDLARVNAMNAIQDQILQNINKGDVLVLGLRYPFYFIDESHEYPASTLRYVGITPADSVRSSKSKFFNEWKEAINEFSSNLNRIGAHLVILTPTPEYPGALGGKCNIEFVEWFNRLQNPSCAVKKLEFIDGEGIYAELISWQETFSNDHDNVYLFNAFEIMCPKATCNYSQETTQFYRDDDHISNYSSAFVLGPKLSLFISTISEK